MSDEIPLEAAAPAGSAEGFSVEDADQLERQQRAHHKRHNRIQSTAAVSSLFVVGAAVLVAALQWSVYRGQLEVMRAQAKDAQTESARAQQNTQTMLSDLETLTRQIAVVAHSSEDQAQASRQQVAALENETREMKKQATFSGLQADASRRQAESMVAQATSIGQQSKMLVEQVGSLNKLADAAVDAAVSSRRVADNSDNTNRPWIETRISITRLDFMPVDPPSGAKPASDVDLSVWPTHAVFLGAKVLLINSGKGVAKNLDVRLKVLLIGPGSETSPTRLLEREALSLCDTASANQLPGKTLFPNHETEEYVYPTEFIRPEYLHQPTPPLQRTSTVHLAVAGCATYTFVNSTATHRTWFTYRVVRNTRDGRTPSRSFDLAIGSALPQGSLALQDVGEGMGAE